MHNFLSLSKEVFSAMQANATSKAQPATLSLPKSSIQDFTDNIGHLPEEHVFLFDGIILGICTRGYVRFKINYKEYQVSSNETFIILPRHIFTIIETSSDLQLKILQFSSDFLLSLPTSPNFDLMRRISSCPCVFIPPQDMENLTSLCTMFHQYETKSETAIQLQRALLLSIAFIIATSFEQSPVCEEAPLSRQESLTKEFFNLLLQHYSVQRNVSFYAAKLYITSKYLSTAVKKVTGYPLQNWLNDLTVIAAKRRIKTTTLTIQQISDELHFPTASSFVRFFRQHTGTTPLKYRKEK